MLPAAPGSLGRQEMKPFIRQLVLKGFRSIPAARIEFDNPTILVGRNASGKSNIVSALSFLADAMRMPLPTVFDRAGGFAAVRNRSSGVGRPPNLAMRVDFQERRRHGFHAFEIRAELGSNFSVLREQCVLYEGKKRSWFDRKGRRFDSNVDGLHPSIDTSSLALPVIGGAKAFNQVWRALSRMRRYSIEPGKLRGMQEPDAGVALLPDGANAASVLERIESRRRDDFERLSSFLEAIVPNTRGISVNRYGKNLSLEITQTWGEGAPKALRFEGFDMSDGTLRAIGLLAAVFQRPAPLLIAVEEPEATIHSGALGAVLDLLWEASERMQVIVTTHSPELLDRREVADRHLRMVEWSEGVTRVGPVSDANRRALREGLTEAGGLLRANALEAAPRSRDSVRRDDLFEDLQ